MGDSFADLFGLICLLWWMCAGLVVSLGWD